MRPHHHSPPHGGQHGQTTTLNADLPVPKFSDGPWGETENEILREAIEQILGHPIRTDIESSDRDKDKSLKWCGIASRCQALGCRRSAKQCRERYINHMAPGRRDKITPEEGQHIMELVLFHGQKWASIGRELNRPENTVKNYWNQERKKRENGKKRASSNSHQVDSRRQHSVRAYSYNHVPREHPHSRRESLCSNPGLVSDHGSPVETSPRSSRHNSFGPVQQLPLPPFHGWKPVPASPLQHGYQMDRTQALSASSAYSTGFPQVRGGSPTHEYLPQRGHSVASHHHSDVPGYAGRRGQQQERFSFDAGHSHADRGFEHRSYAYGHRQDHDLSGSNAYTAQPTLPVQPQAHPVSYAEAHQQNTHRGHWTLDQQPREQYNVPRSVHDSRSSYSYTAPQPLPAGPQTPHRRQRETLPPVSAILNPTASVRQTPQRSSTGILSSKPVQQQGSSEMDLRRILN